MAKAAAPKKLSASRAGLRTMEAIRACAADLLKDCKTKPLNLYDATASDLSDMFTDHPEPSTYKVLPLDERIFDPAKVRLSTSGKPSVRMDRQ